MTTPPHPLADTEQRNWPHGDAWASTRSRAVATVHDATRVRHADEATDAGHDHAEHEHDGHDHAGHDHAGHLHPAHYPAHHPVHPHPGEQDRGDQDSGDQDSGEQDTGEQDTARAATLSLDAIARDIPAPAGLQIALPVAGTVSLIRGMEVAVRGLRLPIGAAVSVDGPRGPVSAEVVAAADGETRLALLGDPSGLSQGDAARPDPVNGQPVGSALLGRVVDALGAPIDGKGPVSASMGHIDREVPPALLRQRITEPMPVGVRVIDLFTTLARGQRVGLFAGSGVGKSTLLGMMARGAEADCVVICLVGERGREVREFLEDDLGPEAAARSAVVVATSDQPALVRVRAVRYATAIAEHLADQGRNVLFLCDSLTRFALAQREVGLAAGEPPTARGFTPSVFAALPRLLERTGPRQHGTITAIYTVLVDGDDHNDPIADTVRGILDGHIVLDRRLAHAGRYPAVDPLMSISRLASKVLPADYQAVADEARRALSAAESVRDLVEVGAYAPGSNPDADWGLAVAPAIIELCRQATDLVSDAAETFAALHQLLESTRADMTAGVVR